MFSRKERIRNIETVFARPKMVRADIDNVSPNLIWPQYLNPEQHADRLCHKMKLLYKTMQLLNWNMIYKDTICLLFKDAK